jgi:hypothetical protein
MSATDSVCRAAAVPVHCLSILVQLDQFFDEQNTRLPDRVQAFSLPFQQLILELWKSSYWPARGKRPSPSLRAGLASRAVSPGARRGSPTMRMLMEAAGVCRHIPLPLCDIFLDRWRDPPATAADSVRNCLTCPRCLTILDIIHKRMKSDRQSVRILA